MAGVFRTPFRRPRRTRWIPTVSGGVPPVSYTEAAETDSSQGFSIRLGFGVASETDTAQTIAVPASVNLGQFSPILRNTAWFGPLATVEGWVETDLNLTHPLIDEASAGPLVYSAATEADTAFTFGIKLGIGLASETDASRPLTPAIGYFRASEADAAQGFAIRLGLGVASETDSSQGLSPKLGIARAAETDSAQGFGITLGFSFAAETDTAGTISSGGTAYTFASETDSARGLSVILGIARANETDAVFAFGIKLGYTRAEETDLALTISDIPPALPVKGPTYGRSLVGDDNDTEPLAGPSRGVLIGAGANSLEPV